MPTYIGFSTINANQPRTTNARNGVAGGPGGITGNLTVGKKFRLTDQPLVVRDLVNALNIRQGEKVGQPEYGTTLWSFVFEPNTYDVQQQLEAEIKRVASLDPRIVVNYVKAFPQENGILIEAELAITPFNEAIQLSVFFDSKTSKATLQ